MTLVPNETEQALNRQYDVYAAAREEYRKKIDEQAARIERLEKALREARAFIDGDSPDWRKLKQMQLAQIDAALEERT